jgi:hypothetical protein
VTRGRTGTRLEAMTDKNQSLPTICWITPAVLAGTQVGRMLSLMIADHRSQIELGDRRAFA